MFPITLKSCKSVLDGITLYEVFDKTTTEQLMNSNLLLEKPHKHIEKVFETEKQQIEQYLSLSTDIDNECKENKTKYGLVPVKYKRANGFSFGRVYPLKSLSLCTIRREVRKAIARHNYKDIDASNAHPEIIYQTCKYHNIECPKLEYYVKNRDDVLKEIMNTYKVNKDGAKLLPIILLYFGSFQTWLKSLKLDLKTEPTQFIKDFIEDRNRYGKEIEDNNADIHAEVIKSKHKQNKYEYNERASVIAIWCQEIENRILETIYKYCVKKGYILKKCAVLCYDGIMIEIENYNDKMLKAFEKLIKDEFGYELKYVSKSMDDNFLEVKEDNVKEQQIDDIKLSDKEFLESLETTSHKHCADLYYKLNSDKYIYSIKSGWYSYNKYNVLESFEKEYPTGLMSSISTTLQDYILPIRNRLMPNDLSFMKHSKNMTKLLKDINNATYINGILKFMKDLYTNNVIDDLIDNKPNLIAFTDKVFDSEKLEFRDIKKDDYICKTTKYNYDKSDKVIRKDIKDVLHSIFEDKEVEDYYLRIKSESLFGNKLQSFIMQVGSGGNGKGILSTIETKSLGDYVKTTENTFLTSAFKQGSANPTLASSKGLRALIISEPSEEDDNGKQTSLNTPFLKLITGGDDITTRGLFQSNITFKALFTPFLQCNTLPCMKKIDKGIMRRVKVIKYPLSFVENPAKSYERKIDYSLQEKFEQVKYAREYLLLLLDTFKTSFDKDNKKIDILTPEKVKEETNNYFIDSNPVKVYLDAFIEITGDKNDKIKSSTLKEDYDDHSDTKLSMPSFIKGMTANGVDNYMSMGYRYFRGIKMKVAQPKPEPEPEPEPKPEQKPKKLIKRLI